MDGGVRGLGTDGSPLIAQDMKNALDCRQ